jgi:hypothetical protein
MRRWTGGLLPPYTPAGNSGGRITNVSGKQMTATTTVVTMTLT